MWNIWTYQLLCKKMHYLCKISHKFCKILYKLYIFFLLTQQLVGSYVSQWNLNSGLIVLFTLQRQKKVAYTGNKVILKIHEEIIYCHTTQLYISKTTGGISDLQLEKYGLSLKTKKYTTFGRAPGSSGWWGRRAWS